MVEILGFNCYLVGDYVTYIDFTFFELCNYMNFLTNGQFIKDHFNMANYITRMISIPSIKKYCISDRFMSRPFNNKLAVINN